MKLRSLVYLFAESLKNLFRHAWMTLVAISAVSVTLLMIGLVLVIGLNVENFILQIEKNTEIRVHLDKSITDDVMNTIKFSLEDMEDVSEVKFSSKDDELKRASKDMGYNSLYELYGGMSNPLSDVFVVKLYDAQKIVELSNEIKDFAGVEKINYGEMHIEKLFNATNWLRKIGIAFILFLAIIAIFLIINTIRVAIFSRRSEIAIMRLIGATNNFIRFPFFLEGIWIGLLGSIAPILIIYSGYMFVSDINFLGGIDLPFLELVPSSPMLFNISALLLMIGCVIGAFASVVSLRKYIRR